MSEMSGVTPEKVNVAMETIDYRLTQIEKSIGDLKNVLVETKLQSRDIKGLAEKQEELEEAINCHEKRISAVESRPLKSKADWVDKTFDIIFKMVLTALIGFFLMKVGINNG
jgi:hypothetical protein